MGKSEENQELTLSTDRLEEIVTQIDDIDVKIAAANGNDSAVRQNLSNKYAEDNADTVDAYVEQLVEQLETFPLEVLIGFSTKLESVVEDKFGDAINDFLNSEVEKATSGDKEDLASLREDRKKAVDAYKSLRVIFETFGFDLTGISEPKRAGRGASKGGTTTPSGRNKEGYRYAINGAERPNSQNLISAVIYAASLGCEKDDKGEDMRMPTKKFKDEFLPANGVKFGEDDTWSVTLPNGTVVSARRFTENEIADFEAAASEKKEEAADEDSEAA